MTVEEWTPILAVSLEGLPRVVCRIQLLAVPINLGTKGGISANSP